MSGFLSAAVPSPLPSLGKGNEAENLGHGGYSEAADSWPGTRGHRPEKKEAMAVTPYTDEFSNRRKIAEFKSSETRRRTGTKGRSVTEQFWIGSVAASITPVHLPPSRGIGIDVLSVDLLGRHAMVDNGTP